PTPSGPLNRVATTAAPPVEFLSVIDCGVSDGDNARSKDLSASDSAGPDANAAGAITGAVPDVAPRPDGMLTPSIGSPNSVASSNAFSWIPRMSGVIAR